MYYIECCKTLIISLLHANEVLCKIVRVCTRVELLVN